MTKEKATMLYIFSLDLKIFLKNSLLLFLLFLYTHCKNKLITQLYAKPNALGAVLEVGIVAHDSIWVGRQGVFLREYLQKSILAPCLHITPADTVHFAGLHRNLVHLAHAPRAGKVHTIINQKALGQTTQYITLPLDSAKLESLVAYIWSQEKKRMRDYYYAFEAGQSTALERWIGRHYSFKMRILPEFQVWKHSPERLWLKTDRGTEKHLIISKSPHPRISKPDFEPLPYPTSVWRTLWRDGYQLDLFIKSATPTLPTIWLEADAFLETFSSSQP